MLESAQQHIKQQEVQIMLDGIQEQEIYKETQNKKLTTVKDESEQELKRLCHTAQIDIIEKVKNILNVRYAKFDTTILVKKLYDRLRKQNKKPSKIQKEKQRLEQEEQQEYSFQNFNMIKTVKKARYEKDSDSDHDLSDNEESESAVVFKHYSQQQSISHTIKVFIKHGYGLVVARRFALRGETIEMNKYNNTIGRIFNNTWRYIESYADKKYHHPPPLRSEEIVQSRNIMKYYKLWMRDDMTKIFQNLMKFNANLTQKEVSVKDITTFYQYMLQMMRKRKKILFMVKQKKQSMKIKEQYMFNGKSQWDKCDAKGGSQDSKGFQKHQRNQENNQYLNISDDSESSSSSFDYIQYKDKSQRKIQLKNSR